MVSLDAPNLPKHLNVKYRPPRISLFPPSYRDRAYLRSVQREILRQQGSTGQTHEYDKHKHDKSVVFQLGSHKNTGKVTKGSQTTETHCYHECSVHQRDGKKNDDKKGSKKQDSNNNSNKKNNKDRGDDSDREFDDSDDDRKQNKTKDKNVGTNDKNKNDKTKSDSKKEDSKFKIPNHLKSFLPYPFTSVNADTFWGNSQFQRPYPEKPFINKEDPNGWNLEYKLEAARRADEKYMWNWLSNQEGNHRKDAFQWLAERDAERQSKLAQASYALAGVSLDPSIGRAPPGFAAGYQNTQNNSFPPNSSSLLACVDQQGNIRLQDGTIVNVTGQNDSFQPPQGLFSVQRHSSGSMNPGFNGNHSTSFGLPQQHWNQSPPWSLQQYPTQNSQSQSNQNFNNTAPGRKNFNSNSGCGGGSGNSQSWNKSNAAPNNNGWKPYDNNNNTVLQERKTSSSVKQTDAPNTLNDTQQNQGWGSNEGWGENGNNAGLNSGNDENSKPNDFFAPISNDDIDQPDAGQEQQVDNMVWSESGDKKPGAATMSGAKGTRTGTRDYGEPAW